MRTGVFGGSFDPPHVGHFLAATDAAERLSLDRVIWVTAAQQPLKTDAPHAASSEQRFAMVAAMLSGSPSFEASRIEIDRPGLSYTVDTVAQLKALLPHDDLVLLVGEDAWSHFDEWREPERIRTLVRIEILARMEGSADRGRVIEVSSTEIRSRVRAGKPIRGFVLDTVAAIIESQGLYTW